MVRNIPKKDEDNTINIYHILYEFHIMEPQIKGINAKNIHLVESSHTSR